MDFGKLFKGKKSIDDGGRIKVSPETFRRGVAITIPENGLSEKLVLTEKEKRPLIVKLGFDPTSKDLHLGHAVVLRKLREFQDAGHLVTVVIGDFTAQIGDPTGKNKTRPSLSKEEIRKNTDTYLDQLAIIIDTKRVVVRFNSEWYKKMKMEDTLRLLARYNLGRMLAREDFKKRLNDGAPIAMHEILYPLLQGYDSEVVRADIEIGGTDQLFNMQVGRALQEEASLPAQAIVCMPILRGTDGTDKMSKSLGNYIALRDEPNDMYAKILSIPDGLIPEYIDLATLFDENEKEMLKKSVADGTNPLEVKKTIAAHIVALYHSEKDARAAETFFYNQFQSSDPERITYEERTRSSLGIQEKDASLANVLVALGAAESKSAAKRLIEQGSVIINGEKITDVGYCISEVSFGTTIRAGKRGFYKIV